MDRDDDFALREEVFTFYFRWCRRGHMVWDRSPITALRCPQCGSAFVVGCHKCKAALPSSFESPPFFTTDAPVYPPDLPNRCPECGKAYPWNAVRRRLARSSLRLWNEFKSLPQPQLYVIVGIIVIALLLVFRFTVREIIELAKSLRQGH